MPLLIALFAWVVLYFVVKSKKSEPQPVETIYSGLHNLALQTKPEKLGLTLNADSSMVYGVVMDWYLAEWNMSLVCFSTGDASVYTSTGGGLSVTCRHETSMLIAKDI